MFARAFIARILRRCNLSAAHYFVRSKRAVKSEHARQVLRSAPPRLVVVAPPDTVNQTPLRRAVDDVSMRRQSSIMRSVVYSKSDYRFLDCLLRLSTSLGSSYEKSRSLEISSSTCCRSSSDTLPSSEGTSVRASSTVSQHNVPTSQD